MDKIDKIFQELLYRGNVIFIITRSQKYLGVSLFASIEGTPQPPRECDIFFLGEKMNGVKPSGKFDFSHKAEDEKVVSTTQ